MLGLLFAGLFILYTGFLIGKRLGIKKIKDLDKNNNDVPDIIDKGIDKLKKK